MSYISTKAQIWYNDFMVGILIFVVGIVIYFQFISNFSFESKDAIDDVLREAKIISNSLMSEGNPRNWTAANVSRIGLTNEDYRLNETKWREFSLLDYNESKRIFSVSANYIVFLEKNGTKKEIAGVTDIGVNSTDYKQLVAVTRIVFWNDSFYEMKVQVWE